MPLNDGVKLCLAMTFRQMSCLDVLGYCTLLMCLVHALPAPQPQPPLLVHYKYVFFALAGIGTVARGHDASKLRRRARRAAMWAPFGLWTGHHALRAHASVLAIASFARPWLATPRASAVLLCVCLACSALHAPLRRRLATRVGDDCVAVPFHVEGCTGVSARECASHCSDEVVQSLWSASIAGASQWEMGFEVCGSQACERVTASWWAASVLDAVFGPLGVVPCGIAFCVGALYEHLHHVAGPVVGLGSACGLALVAHIDRIILVDDLFRGDPLTTTVIALVGCFHVHRSRLRPARGTALLHWVARHSAGVYALSPLLFGYGIKGVSLAVFYGCAVVIVLSATARGRVSILVDVFAPCALWASLGHTPLPAAQIQ